MSRLALVLVTCLALHPAFHWTLLRARDGSDEPWNLLALAFVPCWVWFDRSPAPQHIELRLPALGLAAYIATYPLLLPLPRGALAMTARTALVSPLYLRTRFRGHTIFPEPDRAAFFVAARAGKRALVSEAIHDRDGRTFSDVSAWYWAASRGSSRGPWWSITTVRAQ